LLVTALAARWRAATRTFTWVNCDHPRAYLIDREGAVSELAGPVHPPLGVPGAEPTFTPTERHLGSGERLILVTKGITERRTEGGGQLGLEGIKCAVEQVEVPTAAATALGIQEAVTNSWREPLEDDGTVVVLAVE
jgi:serine phosphatase RsbU (regulator of sigma subunit)